MDTVAGFVSWTRRRHGLAIGERTNSVDACIERPDEAGQLAFAKSDGFTRCCQIFCASSLVAGPADGLIGPQVRRPDPLARRLRSNGVRHRHVSRRRSLQMERIRSQCHDDAIGGMTRENRIELRDLSIRWARTHFHRSRRHRLADLPRRIRPIQPVFGTAADRAKKSDLVPALLPVRNQAATEMSARKRITDHQDPFGFRRRGDEMDREQSDAHEGTKTHLTIVSTLNAQWRVELAFPGISS